MDTKFDFLIKMHYQCICFSNNTIAIYLTFLSCSLNSYHSSNFAITIVVKIIPYNAIVLSFVSVLYIGSWPLFYISPHIAIALPNITKVIVVAFSRSYRQ